MKHNNKGYTIVELIVVIAIMAVMLTAVGMSINVVLNSRARECAENISAVLKSTRTGCMSREDEVMELFYHDKEPANGYPSAGYYTKNTMYTITKDVDGKAQSVAQTQTEIKKVGGKNVTITITYDDSSTEKLEAQTIAISYDRASGEQDKVKINGSPTIKCITKIEVASGTGKKTIVMTPQTGLHSVE